jgi:MFS superfamily sulfate permease-like transporter
VLIGFMSAGVLNIILSQAVAMIGIKGSSVNVIESIENIVNGINQFKLWDMVLGITCISILLLIWVRNNSLLTIEKIQYAKKTNKCRKYKYRLYYEKRFCVAWLLSAP